MKKFVIAVALFPVSVVLEWVFSSLSEKFEQALEDFDLDDE